jgi:pilus assembly protein TadC
MKFKIPFTFSDLETLKKRPSIFRRLVKHRKYSKLEDQLQKADANITREEYLAIVLKTFSISFFIAFLITTTLLVYGKASKWYILSPAISLLIAGFIILRQLLYPKIYVNQKERNIERNLIPALEDMLVQLNSGIPLFSIMVSISSSDYGELSLEFKKAVKKINAGSPQMEVLDEMGEKNSSLFFRRTLWQISNGMKAGSDISLVIKDSIQSLNEEQILQIQNYGNKLNPLIMFYMLISVIMPALSITFLTIISSLVNLPKTTTMILFFGLFAIVLFIQVMFMGIIRTARPSLL